ncbi:MAG: IS701 family transposase [Mesorhizobium sp.]|nr:MAG: IS701 family transposase [Mesorhizobium sp.]
MPDWTAESEAAFDAYVDALIGVIGHADRAEPLKDYCLGLLMPTQRKSVEPLAAVTAPSRAAKHQSLMHFVGEAPWSDAPLLGSAGSRLGSSTDRAAWTDPGKHSVGVARQYCGQLGKQDNCQIAVSLSIANDAASLPIAYELYLPHSWAENLEQRKKAKIPAAITFRTKPQIALEQIGTAKAEGVAPGVVLADAGYGADGGFRTGLSELGLTYVVGVQPTREPAAAQAIGAEEAGRRLESAEPTITSRSRPRPWPRSLTPRLGARSPGAKEPTPSSIPASPPCACGRHPGTMIGPRETIPPLNSNSRPGPQNT